MTILETAGLSETSKTTSLASESLRPPGASAGMDLDEETDRTEPDRPTPNGNVLVVDDSLVARRYVEKVLVEGGLCKKVLLAKSANQGLELIQAGEIDLVLCDVNMPGLGGLDFLTQLRADREVREVPVIMLTGEEDLEAKLECLESGASDYVIKPFADKELVARARIHLQLKQLRDELRRKNEQLSELARLDSLTGIPNRHSFFEALERELSRARRQGTHLTVGMIDIDYFKQVNDDYGHLFGDQALVRTAKLLTSGLRDYDLLGRYGGEEFAVVFVDSGAEIAMKIAERCRRLVAENPIALNGRERGITVSIGLASTSNPDPSMETDLISRADSALYAAKQQGRNRVVADSASDQ